MDFDKEPYIRQAHKLIPDFMGIILGLVAAGIALLVANLVVSDDVRLPEAIQMAILIFIATTAWIQWRSFHSSREFERSKAYLENAIELIGHAKTLLDNGNDEPTTDLISWVSAARQLSRANEISSQITVDAHERIFAAEHDFQRHVFLNFLQIDGEPLPASFFLGDPYSSDSFGQQALKALRRGSPAWIPEQIVSVIYRFAHFPEGYTDPLRSEKKLSAREREIFGLINNPGVESYLSFRERFAPAALKIYKKRTADELGRFVSAVEIDQFMGELDTSAFYTSSKPSTEGKDPPD
jgi:hypothetical protein